jgi:UDP-N-acetylglucosamine--N-acetylmuramyl-(pentapeptide) pyrophosphoryl-undecaprenol N-acetylglucosamine transferase
MGGYSSFPVCIAAKILKIPFIIYENNLFIGKSNKYLLPFAYKLFVAYHELEGINNKYKEKSVKVGNIIREEILNQNIQKKINHNENSINILILGGSQAAKSFGEKLPLVFEKCVSDNINIKLYQQCVPSQNEHLTKLYNSLNIEFELFNFTNHILNYYSKADLAITRSGSSVIAELLNCKIPFVAIPYPYAADNHQEKNAIYFKNRGYGFLINEKEISSELFPLIKEIYRDKKILKQISDKQSTHSDKKVFEKIDNEILNLFND